MGSDSVRTGRSRSSIATLTLIGILGGPVSGRADSVPGGAAAVAASEATAETSTGAAAAADVAPASEVIVETPPFTLRASEFLDAELRSGEHFTVAEEISNDGYMNTYQLESEFGTFTVEGTAELGRRIHEIEAIAQLAEVSRTEAFADAVAKSATRQVRAAQDVVEHPVKTAKGIPGGVKRFVKRTSRQVQDLTEDVGGADDDANAKKEKNADEKGENLAEQGSEAAVDYGKKWVGYTPARRQWAQELGVDPYSDNEVLNQQLTRVSQAATVGSLGMRFVPIPRVDVLGYMKNASDLVWTTDPLDLRMHNEQILYPMGVSEAEVEALYDNRYQTPSTITFLVSALAAMDGVEGRPAWVVKASQVDSRSAADYMIRAVNFLAAYHEKKKPIIGIVGGEAYPHGLTADGTLVFAAPMDYIHWTDDLATLVDKRLPPLVESTGASELEVWIEGSASERARTGLERHGFEVHTDAFDGLGVTFGEATAVAG